MTYTSKPLLHYPPNASLTQILLDRNLNNTPADKPAIIDGVSGQVAYTYESFRAGVKTLAAHLHRDFHFEQGTTVGFLATNTVHYPLLVHGILATGATVSALNPAYQPDELAHALHLARPSHIFVDESLLNRLEKALSSDSRYLAKPVIHVISQNGFNIEKILRTTDTSDHKSLPTRAKQTADDVAFICFSSGTTGTVKAVKLSHGNVVANMFQHREGLEGDFDAESVFVLVLPFFHILGLGVFTCQYILQGYPTVVFPRLDFAALVRSISRDRITHINVVPTLALEFLRNPIAAKGDYSTVKCLMNAAAPLKQELSDQISKRLDCVITQWYGMTEASPSVISQRQDHVHIPNSIGKLLPGLEMKIVDADGKECLPQMPGELCIRGPNIMQGYIGPKEMTTAAMTSDGFMRTGDIGYIDRDGFVYLVDRAKEMMKVRGHQVAPAELETVLLAHPLVKDAAVKGFYSDDDASEIPVGYIVTDVAHSQHAALKKELQQLVEQKVAKYKRITGGLHIVPEIPRNASGKILRRVLPNIVVGEAATIIRTSKL